MSLYPFCVVGDVENIVRQNLGSSKTYASTTTPTLLEVKSFMDNIASHLRSAADTAGYDIDNLHEASTAFSEKINSGGTAIYTSDFSEDADNWTGTDAILTANQSIAGVTETLEIACTEEEDFGYMSLPAANFTDAVGFISGRCYKISFEYYTVTISNMLTFTTAGGTALTTPAGETATAPTLTSGAWSTHTSYLKVPSNATNGGLRFRFGANTPSTIYIKNITVTPIYRVSDASELVIGDVVKIEGTYTSGRQYEFVELNSLDSTTSVVGMTLSSTYYTAANLYVVNDALRILRHLNAVGASALALRAGTTGHGSQVQEYAQRLWDEYTAGLESIATIENYLRGATTDTDAIESASIMSYGSEHPNDSDVEPVFTRETDL